MMNKNQETEIVFNISYSTSFKKDIKKYRNQSNKMTKIRDIISILMQKGTNGIPKEKKPHPLTGNYKGFLECHIEPDLLIIWRQNDTEKTIVLERLGSHSELFD